MIEIQRTDSGNRDFFHLVQDLDAELAGRDGEGYSFYAQFNKIDALKYVVVAYENGKPVGCGALKEYSPKKVEVKRMYTSPESRGKGVAGRVLRELEAWAAELAYEACLLETGARQPEAIRLYQNNGYRRIPNYGPYVGVEDSLCFEKDIR